MNKGNISIRTSSKFKIKAENERKKNEKERKERQAIASEKARILWEALTPADESHPYCQRKQVNSYGLRINSQTNSLAVPLRDVSGNVKSLQWISQEGGKKLFEGASTEGLFFSIALDSLHDGDNIPILIGEGYATVAKVYSLRAILLSLLFHAITSLILAKSFVINTSKERFSLSPMMIKKLN